MSGSELNCQNPKPFGADTPSEMKIFMRSSEDTAQKKNQIKAITKFQPVQASRKGTQTGSSLKNRKTAPDLDAMLIITKPTQIVGCDTICHYTRLAPTDGAMEIFIASEQSNSMPESRRRGLRSREDP
jgi:hypothetical protein